MKRIYHHWQSWECVAGGMYETEPPLPFTPEQAREQYKQFLGDIPRFESSLRRVLAEWPISCEQFLSNEHINRIAWLGQSSMCIENGISSYFCGGFMLLSIEQQQAANEIARKYLNIWLRTHRSDSEIQLDCGEKPEPDFNIDTSIGTTHTKIGQYISTWKRRGYADDISDEVPSRLAEKLLAPSYKAIAHAILRNDMQLKSLGFTAPQSKSYGILKRIEIAARPAIPNSQLSLF